MLSFHNDEKVKQKYIERIKKHKEADAIIQGTGWENGRGCAVGCTLENYDHSRYPIELGLPEWLAHLEDAIFEGLEKKDALEWPLKFLESIPIGVDVENVKHRLAIYRMDNLIKLQEKLLEENKNIKDVFEEGILYINIVKKCHETELNQNHCDWSDARSTDELAALSDERSENCSAGMSWAFSSALSAARSAAWSAGNSPEESARLAAMSAEMSDSSDVMSAARSVWKQELEMLLKLLSECK